MIKIYHNPRCQKSRQGLALITSKQTAYETVLYMKNPLKEDELKEILTLLKLSPLELVRKNEALWKEKFKGKILNDSQIIEAMIDHPKLIERPIIVNKNKAVIGRPVERILEII